MYAGIIGITIFRLHLHFWWLGGSFEMSSTPPLSAVHLALFRLHLNIFLHFSLFSPHFSPRFSPLFSPQLFYPHPFSCPHIWSYAKSVGPGMTRRESGYETVYCATRRGWSDTRRLNSHNAQHPFSMQMRPRWPQKPFLTWMGLYPSIPKPRPAPMVNKHRVLNRIGGFLVWKGPSRPLMA